MEPEEHDIIIILGAFDTLISNCLGGSLAALRVSVNAVQYKINHNTIPPMQREAAHDAMYSVQTWLTAGNGTEAVTETVAGLKSALDVFL